MMLDISISILYIKCIKGIEKPEKKRKGISKMFTTENTTGYTKEQIEIMNDLYNAEAGDDADQNDALAAKIEEKCGYIFNKIDHLADEYIADYKSEGIIEEMVEDFKKYAISDCFGDTAYAIKDAGIDDPEGVYQALLEKMVSDLVKNIYSE